MTVQYSDRGAAGRGRRRRRQRRSQHRRSGRPARWEHPEAAVSRGWAESSCQDPWHRRLPAPRGACPGWEVPAVGCRPVHALWPSWRGCPPPRTCDAGLRSARPSVHPCRHFLCPQDRRRWPILMHLHAHTSSGRRHHPYRMRQLRGAASVAARSICRVCPSHGASRRYVVARGRAYLGRDRRGSGPMAAAAAGVSSRGAGGRGRGARPGARNSRLPRPGTRALFGRH
jgi:hypothetical protein